MSPNQKQKITVEVSIDAPISKVWSLFTEPEHVVKWNNASDDWHTTTAKNDVRNGGTFDYRMEAKDGSTGFNFVGTYDEVIPKKRMTYTMDDGRRMEVVFKEKDGKVYIAETFEAEDINSIELQRTGWQAILDNFKKYVEE